MSVRTRPTAADDRRGRRLFAGVLVGAVVAIAALTACSTADSGSPTGGAPAPAAEKAGGGGDAYTAADGGVAAAPGAPPADTDANRAPVKVQVAERSLIYTGSITIR